MWNAQCGLSDKRQNASEASGVTAEKQLNCTSLYFPVLLPHCQFMCEKMPSMAVHWFSCFTEDTITVSWCGCSFFLLCFTFLSAGAEWVSWACQRTASDGRRNPVCKSHRGDSAAVRGLCWLCFTTAVLSCWQGRVAVHRRCNTGRKCTATHAQSLHPVCARCHHTERHKEEMHFTSHVWRPTRPCNTYR